MNDANLELANGNVRLFFSSANKKILMPMASISDLHWFLYGA
jgi:hypothetical protein